MSTQQSEKGLVILKSHEGEPVKQFVELDAQARPYRVYTAHFLAGDGAPCGVELYEYVSPTNSSVLRRNEFMGNWDSATMNSVDPNVPDELKK